MYLTNKRQDEIDAAIGNLQLNTGISFPEDSIGMLLSKLDILYNPEVDLPGNISGVVFEREGKMCILANKRDPLKRRIFTLAHELGHLILKHQMESNGEKYRFDRYEYQDNTEETEANYFAASLLVPKDKLLWALSQTKDISIVARYFGVSDAVIQNRIRWILNNE